MNIFIFDSKVTDHVGRLASYSHYLFLFFMSTSSKAATNQAFMAKISEYIFILASSNYFIEYVTDWFQKYLNMLTMLSATVIES